MDVMWSVVKCADHQLWEYPFHLLLQTLLFSPLISKYLLELMFNISNEILLPQAPARTFITHESPLHSPAPFWLCFAGDKKLAQRTADGHQARGRDGDVRWRHGGRSWEQGLRGFRYEDASMYSQLRLPSTWQGMRWSCSPEDEHRELRETAVWLKWQWSFRQLCWAKNTSKSYEDADTTYDLLICWWTWMHLCVRLILYVRSYVSSDHGTTNQ